MFSKKQCGKDDLDDIPGWEITRDKEKAHTRAHTEEKQKPAYAFVTLSDLPQDMLPLLLLIR